MWNSPTPRRRAAPAGRRRSAAARRARPPGHAPRARSRRLRRPQVARAAESPARPRAEDERRRSQPVASSRCRQPSRSIARAVAVEQAEVEHRVDAVGGSREPRAGGGLASTAAAPCRPPGLLEQVGRGGRAKSGTSARRAAAARRRSSGSTRPRSRARAARRTACFGVDADEQRPFEPLGRPSSPARALLERAASRRLSEKRERAAQQLRRVEK